MQEVTAEEASFLNSNESRSTKVRESADTEVWSVSNPKQVGEGVSAYITYTVTGANKKSVVRRYSDFEWVHEQLCLEFLDVLVPPIPEKQIINRLASSTVEYRRKELQRFVNRCMAHPTLSKSASLKAFLTATETEMGTQRQQKFQRPGEESEDTVNSFFGWASAKFEVATGQAEPTKEINPTFDELKNYVEGFNRELTLLQEKVSASISKKKQFDQTLYDFSQSASALSTVEGAVDPLLSQFWQKLSYSLKRMAELNAQLCSSETDSFDDALKDYIRCSEAGKDLLENRIKLLEKLQIAQRKNAVTVASLDAEFKAMSLNIQSELDQFKERKTFELRAHLRELVRINVEHQQQVVDLWKDLLSELEEPK